MNKHQLRQKVVLIRHGETEWAVSGKHTSYTDLALTSNGRQEALLLLSVLKAWEFTKVLSSPLKRAEHTCKLSGMSNYETDPDLSEWNYGRFEGLTTAEIHKDTPHWDLYQDGCPEGESPEAVKVRVDRVIKKIREIDGDVAVFTHGHLARAFATRWIDLPIENGHLFVQDTATLNILGSYYDSPAIVTWNAKLNSSEYLP